MIIEPNSNTSKAHIKLRARRAGQGIQVPAASHRDLSDLQQTLAGARGVVSGRAVAPARGGAGARSPRALLSLDHLTSVSGDRRGLLDAFELLSGSGRPHALPAASGPRRRGARAPIRSPRPRTGGRGGARAPRRSGGTDPGQDPGFPSSAIPACGCRVFIILVSTPQSRGTKSTCAGGQCLSGHGACTLEIALSDRLSVRISRWRGKWGGTRLTDAPGCLRSR